MEDKQLHALFDVIFLQTTWVLLCLVPIQFTFTLWLYYTSLSVSSHSAHISVRTQVSQSIKNRKLFFFYQKKRKLGWKFSYKNFTSSEKLTKARKQKVGNDSQNDSKHGMSNCPYPAWNKIPLSQICKTNWPS